MFIEPVRRRIYLMRHGEAAYYRPDGSPIADSRVAPLTPLGREQAARQREALSVVHFDRAVCSGLQRTVETATIVLAGRASPRLEVVSALAEIQGGSDFDRVAADPAAWVAHVANPWPDADELEARFIGGESFRDFDARVIPAFAALLADPDWRTLLVVAHGGTNRSILNHVMNLPWQRTRSIEQDTACFNIIDVDGPPGHPERMLVRALNVTAYDMAKSAMHLTDLEHTARRMAERLRK